MQAPRNAGPGPRGRRRCTGFLGRGPHRVPRDPRAALLVPQDRQRPQRIAEVRSARGEAALAEIWHAEDKEHGEAAARAFAAGYGTKWPKAATKITDDLDVLLAFYDYPAEHWVHLRTTNPIWVLYLPRWVGRCFPGQSWKRPALTLNAIDAVRLSWTRNVGPAA
jgi:hypothetical protein